MNDAADSSIRSMPEATEEEQVLLNQILKWMTESEGSTCESQWRLDSTEDYDFYAGNQDDIEVLAALEKQRRPDSVYNTILPKINMLCGLASQSNRAPYIFPVGQEDQPMTELMNGTFKHFRNKMFIKDIENDCFSHAAKSGRSFQYYYVNTDNPYKPEIKCVRLPGKDVLLDPRSVEYDLSDARYVIISRWFSEDDIKAFFPDMPLEEIKSLAASRTDIPLFYDASTDLYRLSECWYRKYVAGYAVINPVTQEPELLSEERYKEMVKVFEQSGFDMSKMQIVKTRYKRIHYAVFANNRLLEYGESPYRHNEFPVVLYGAYKADNTNMWFSVISMMKDPQRGRNQVRRQLIHLLNTAPKGILVHEVGAIVNEDEWETRSSEPTFRLILSKGSMEKYKFTDQPSISPLYGDLDMLFEADIKNTSGIQDSLLGIQTTSREPGITVKMRQESGIAVLYILFDNYRRSRIKSAHILLSMIQQYVTTARMIRIEGPEGMSLLQINSQLNPTSEGFNDVTAGEYDLQIDEGVDNSTMRLTIAQLLVDFAQNNPGTIPPELILEYSDLPFSVQQKVKAYTQAMLAREEKMRAAELEIKKQGMLTKALGELDRNERQSKAAKNKTKGGSK